MKNTLDILLQYIKSNKMKLGGCLKLDVEKKNYKALQYVIYAIDNFRGNAKLKKKIQNLASRRGNNENENDIKRNYHNQLAEFHALYILTEKMGYNFIDFDVRSDKIYANTNKDCDLLVEKSEYKIFVEVKDVSSEIMSAYRNEYTPKIPEVLGKWIKRQIKKADNKGADFLVVRVPVWLSEHPSNLTKLIDKFLEKISKDIYQKNGKYYWNIKDAEIRKLVFIHDSDLYGVIEIIKQVLVKRTIL